MEYKSLYQYLGKAAGGELGKKVMDKAIKHEIKYQKQEVDPKLVPCGFVYSYPVNFLDNFFKKSNTGSTFGDLERRLELLEKKYLEKINYLEKELHSQQLKKPQLIKMNYHFKKINI